MKVVLRAKRDRDVRVSALLSPQIPNMVNLAFLSAD
jgi:hypothetical protein